MEAVVVNLQIDISTCYIYTDVKCLYVSGVRGVDLRLGLSP